MGVDGIRISRDFPTLLFSGTTELRLALPGPRTLRPSLVLGGLRWRSRPGQPPQELWLHALSPYTSGTQSHQGSTTARRTSMSISSQGSKRKRCSIYLTKFLLSTVRLKFCRVCKKWLLNYLQVSWEEPIFADNVKITHVMASKLPGYFMREGRHDVLYQVRKNYLSVISWNFCPTGVYTFV